MAIGITFAASIAKYATGLLFGVDPTAAANYLATTVALLMVALAACYLPARNASRADPMSVLRQD